MERPPSGGENAEKQEAMEALKALFAEAERAFDSGGRDAAKPYLGRLYDSFRALNQSSQEAPTILWNPQGSLSEEEFNELDLRRKKLSNAVGMINASYPGGIRHDIYKI